MFPHQEPCVRGPPRRICTRFFEGGPLTHGSWWGNIVDRTPPRGGGCSFDQIVATPYRVLSSGTQRQVVIFVYYCITLLLYYCYYCYYCTTVTTVLLYYCYYCYYCTTVTTVLLYYCITVLPSAIHWNSLFSCRDKRQLIWILHSNQRTASTSSRRSARV